MCRMDKDNLTYLVHVFLVLDTTFRKLGNHDVEGFSIAKTWEGYDEDLVNGQVGRRDLSCIQRKESAQILRERFADQYF